MNERTEFVVARFVEKAASLRRRTLRACAPQWIGTAFIFATVPFCIGVDAPVVWLVARCAGYLGVIGSTQYITTLLQRRARDEVTAALDAVKAELDARLETMRERWRPDEQREAAWREVGEIFKLLDESDWRKP